MVYVSSYEDALRESMDEAFKKLPEQHEKLVKDITDKIWNEVHDQLRYYTEENLAECIKDDIFQRAAKVAESMLMNALAGDDQIIRNLFGFNDWYMRNLYSGKLPTQWALIDAIAERKPDIFRDERIAQQAAQIAELQREVKRKEDYIQWQREKIEGTAA